MTLPGALAVVTIGQLPRDAAVAITAGGARIVEARDWDAIDDLALGLPGAPVIAVAPVDIGHGPLEQLATMLEATGTPAVIAFEAEALDAVAAVLMGPAVQLLCDPAPSDWAAALALAQMQAHMAPRGVREGDDGERLRRLNEEVARIAALLASLVEEPATDEQVEARRTRYAAGPADTAPIDPDVIRRTIRARRLRGQFFPARLMEDPGWDILLDLFAAELEASQVSVSSLCIASAVAPTTALRWISRMADAELLVRRSDPRDKRRAFLVLSAAASAGMRGYVVTARKAGLPIA